MSGPFSKLLSHLTVGLIGAAVATFVWANLTPVPGGVPTRTISGTVAAVREHSICIKFESAKGTDPKGGCFGFIGDPRYSHSGSRSWSMEPCFDSPTFDDPPKDTASQVLLGVVDVKPKDRYPGTTGVMWVECIDSRNG